MKWQNLDDSNENVDDRRGSSGGGGGIKLGIGGIIVVGIISLLLGKNPLQMIGLVQQMSPQQTTQQHDPSKPLANDEQASFARRIFHSTTDVWGTLIKNYQPPTMVLFDGTTTSSCGGASASTGPFYCPADRKVYLDVSFFQELNKLANGTSGDFANAYVIAHEVGHHIQNLLGISDKLDNARGRASEKEYNRLSVKLELQADFFAGVWANHANSMKNILETGDLEKALNAASAIGDDRLQKQAQGYVVPDAFTHGTSEQRMYWFKKGFTTGDMNQGDTFSDPSL